MVEGSERGEAAAGPDARVRGGTVRPRLVAVGLLAAVSGATVGAWVDRTWPNAVYGMHVITFGLALSLALVGVTVLRRGPIGQAFGVGSLAALAGVYAGLTLFGGPEPRYASGTMTLWLERPFLMTQTVAAQCTIEGDRRSVTVELDELPIKDKHTVTLLVAEGVSGEEVPASRSDGRRLEIILEGTGSQDDEDARGVILYAADSSVFDGRMDDSGGNARFAELAASTYPPGPPVGLNDLSFAGRIEWVCSRYQGL